MSARRSLLFEAVAASGGAIARASLLLGASALGLPGVEAAGTDPAAAGHALPAAWSLLPFAALLLAIAGGPVLAPRWWHHWYPHVAIGLGAITLAYYLVGLGDAAPMAHAGFEYASFITLIGALYLCSGGIVVGLHIGGTPLTNVLLLAGGAVLSNVVGTTGASLLLIRPFMRVNRGRLRPYHIVFFIFLVSNVGGALTPIGDPPLLLGYLRGIDFLHFLELNLLPWLTCLGLLLAMFWVFDWRNGALAGVHVTDGRPTVGSRRGRILWMSGWVNLVLMALTVGVLFLDPGRLPWVPGIPFHGQRVSFVRELLLIAIGVAAWRWSRHEHLQANGFTFAPLREVALLFIGIFATMVPALELIRHEAQTGTIAGLPLTPSMYYFGTGFCSAVLDNAPTFIAFLAGLEGQFGVSAAELGHASDPVIAHSLGAAAAASVFWGAMTYIGNGPNFMVKAIAETVRDERGEPAVAVPGFFQFLRYSLPILLPVLVVVWVIFYR
jgi:Na+/H+ antiporter NhaD/arsenite permease-like protein